MNYYARLEQTDNVTMKDPDGIWFGDPCYMVPDHLWDTWCNHYSSYERQNPNLPRCYIAECRSERHTFYTWSTAFGDGCFGLFVNDERVADLGVDAGTLSAIPMSLIKRWHDGVPADLDTLGHVIKDTHVGGEMTMDGGDLFWGDVRLPTGICIDSEDEYEEYDYCDEESYV